ncbi:hypothetical protein N7540_005579 [Penicillium herquei]|nr:hypothetical protein N7540_005579 [Penicillium herquei]
MLSPYQLTKFPSPVPYTVSQAILILGYLYISSSSIDAEERKSTLIARTECEWTIPDGRIPNARDSLMTTSSLPSISISQFELQVDHLLDVLKQTSNRSNLYYDRPKRKMGSRACIALLCFCFDVIPDMKGHESTDPWLNDTTFVKTMSSHLARSPLFSKGINKDQLSNILLNLEANLSMEDEYSAMIQPQLLQPGLDSLGKYYETVLCTITADLFIEIWEEGEIFLIEDCEEDTAYTATRVEDRNSCSCLS